MTTAPSSVLIAGAGMFGLATAVEILKKRPSTEVTVLERSTRLPALDAASTDINKVVRWDYGDKEYALLAREAIQTFRTAEWKPYFEEVGVVVDGIGSTSDPKDDPVLANLRVLEENGGKYHMLNNRQDFKEALTGNANGDIPVGKFDRYTGYKNHEGGYMHAEKALTHLLNTTIKLGGRVLGGEQVVDVIYNNNKTDIVGLRTATGNNFYADKTIVATGSWTPATFGPLNLIPTETLVATGQTIAMMKLPQDLADKYRNISIFSIFTGANGFYLFPPTKDNIFKFAIHGAGYLAPDEKTNISTPRTACTNNGADKAWNEQNGKSWLPKDSLDRLRNELAAVFPELAAQKITETRMCFYCEGEGANFLVDYHPQYPSLFIASGGSGHGLKFMPVIGKYVLKRFDNELEEPLKSKWAFTSNPAKKVKDGEDQRAGAVVQKLDLNKLASLQDLAQGIKAHL